MIDAKDSEVGSKANCFFRVVCESERQNALSNFTICFTDLPQMRSKSEGKEGATPGKK